MRAIKIIFVNLSVLLALLLVLELVARQWVIYDPGYYTGVRASNKCIDYPYGRICLNENGLPDKEYTQNPGKPVVGYFGDSVCFGVGAGMGYRITDYLEQANPRYEHRNYCNIGDGLLNRDTLAGIKKRLKRVDLVVFLLNLNDISPLITEMAGEPYVSPPGTADNAIDASLIDSFLQVAAASDNPQTEQHMLDSIVAWLPRIKVTIYPVDQYLRGKSYLYNYVRTQIKSWLTVKGIEANGYYALELHPESNRNLIEYAANKINDFYRIVIAKGKQFILVVLPYEMQISAQAADEYSRRGVIWEAEFEAGKTQQILIENLSGQIDYYDARHAFAGLSDNAKVGQYYVYDKGDKIDWNHPNRSGHRKIFEYLQDRKMLGVDLLQ